jgi:hypothetical protein
LVWEPQSVRIAASSCGLAGSLIEMTRMPSQFDWLPGTSVAQWDSVGLSTDRTTMSSHTEMSLWSPRQTYWPISRRPFAGSVMSMIRKPPGGEAFGPVPWSRLPSSRRFPQNAMSVPLR